VALDVAPRQALPGRQLLGPADVLPLTDADLPERAAARFGLGAVVGPSERRHGGVNDLWRVQTTTGVFAVHAMKARLARVDRCEAVAGLERAAAAAGVPLAPPVADPTSGRAAVRFDADGPLVVVHEWVDGEPVDVDRCPPSLYRGLGTALGRLHALDAPWPAALDDGLDVHPTEDEWRRLAAESRAHDLPWADAIDEGAPQLVAALRQVDGWDAAAGETTVVGHRDLTSQNVLDRGGSPVLIDWEDAGPIAPGTELGRTALDNVGRDGVLDDARLEALLRGYAAERPLPPLGPHWCSLWIRGLVVFADHCARSCVDGAGDPSLLAFQTDVLLRTVPHLGRRFELVPTLLAQFEAAAARAVRPG
jgi:Ser/Thr protein kinase RdoA (MazF antagonist)